MRASLRDEQKQSKMEVGDFLVLFLTLTSLVVFALLRYPLAEGRENRSRAKESVFQILRLENKYKRDNGRFGTLAEIGFAPALPNNFVQFSLSFENGLTVRAQESPHFDAFGNHLTGDEYFLGTPNGSVEYGRAE